MDKTLQKGTLNSNPFNIITQSDILTDEDIKSLTPLTGELQEAFVKSQLFRTKTEMELSVLNNVKHPTHASKYWQSMREQNVMFNELVMLSYEYRKNIVEIKKLERQLKEEQDDLEQELLGIEIEKKMFISKKHERAAKDRIRELKLWSNIKEREAALMSENELSGVDDHQLISYTKRWINQTLVAGNNGSPSENQNLRGQLVSGLRACKDANLLDKVLEGYDEDVKKNINKLI